MSNTVNGGGNRRRSYVLTCDEDEEGIPISSSTSFKQFTTPITDIYQSDGTSSTMVKESFDRLANSLQVPAQRDGPHKRVIMATDSGNLSEEDDPLNQRRDERNASPLKDVWDLLVLGLPLDNLSENTRKELSLAQARYDSGSEKQAPKLIAKLKKQMDTVIANFDKMNKDHETVKEELDKSLTLECELAYQLEAVEDAINDIEFGPESDIYKRYNKTLPTIANTNSPPTSKKSIGVVDNEFLTCLLKSLDSYLKAHPEDISLNVNKALDTNSLEEEKEFLKLYKTLLSDLEVMDKKLGSFEKKIEKISQEIKALDATNERLTENNERLKRDVTRRRFEEGEDKLLFVTSKENLNKSNK
ncbi:unnamed protein product [Gordionus sp. m RMFG-2023]|uniref:uncharacterized protein LOC135923703 isoform X2 n=1 Tax=Gordionus sp. m RMFG-2023 TaxID=3053472 RepID=UPI0030DFCD06